MFLTIRRYLVVILLFEGVLIQLLGAAHTAYELDDAVGQRFGSSRAGRWLRVRQIPSRWRGEWWLGLLVLPGGLVDWDANHCTRGGRWLRRRGVAAEMKLAKGDAESKGAES